LKPKTRLWPANLQAIRLRADRIRLGGTGLRRLNKIIILMLALILPVSGLFLMLAFFRPTGKLRTITDRHGRIFRKLPQRIWQKDASLTTLHIEPKKAAVVAIQRSATEIHGDLERLSQLIDSRGWNKQQTLLKPTSSFDSRPPPPTA